MRFWLDSLTLKIRVSKNEEPLRLAPSPQALRPRVFMVSSRPLIISQQQSISSAVTVDETASIETRSASRIKFFVGLLLHPRYETMD